MPANKQDAMSSKAEPGFKLFDLPDEVKHIVYGYVAVEGIGIWHTFNSHSLAQLSATSRRSNVEMGNTLIKKIAINIIEGDPRHHPDETAPIRKLCNLLDSPKGSSLKHSTAYLRIIPDYRQTTIGMTYDQFKDLLRLIRLTYGPGMRKLALDLNGFFLKSGEVNRGDDCISTLKDLNAKHEVRLDKLAIMDSREGNLAYVTTNELRQLNRLLSLQIADYLRVPGICGIDDSALEACDLSSLIIDSWIDTVSLKTILSRSKGHLQSLSIQWQIKYNNQFAPNLGHKKYNPYEHCNQTRNIGLNDLRAALECAGQHLKALKLSFAATDHYTDYNGWKEFGPSLDEPMGLAFLPNLESADVPMHFFIGIQACPRKRNPAHPNRQPGEDEQKKTEAAHQEIKRRFRNVSKADLEFVFPRGGADAPANQEEYVEAVVRGGVPYTKKYVIPGEQESLRLIADDIEVSQGAKMGFGEEEEQVEISFDLPTRAIKELLPPRLQRLAIRPFFMKKRELYAASVIAEFSDKLYTTARLPMVKGSWLMTWENGIKNAFEDNYARGFEGV